MVAFARRMTDLDVAALARHCAPTLVEVDLRACPEVSAASVLALAEACKNLAAIGGWVSWREPAAARAPGGAARDLALPRELGAALRDARAAGAAVLSAEASCTDRLLAQFVEHARDRLLLARGAAASEGYELVVDLSRCGQVADGALRALAGFGDAVVALALAGGGDVSDGGVAELLGRCGGLRALSVADCAQLTDAAFERAGPLVALRLAGLPGVTDRAVAGAVERSPALRELSLRRLPKLTLGATFADFGVVADGAAPVPPPPEDADEHVAPFLFCEPPTDAPAVAPPAAAVRPPPPPLELVRLEVDGCENVVERLLARVAARCPQLEHVRCVRARATADDVGRLLRACPRLASLGLDRCALEDPALADADDDGDAGSPGDARRLTLAKHLAAAGRCGRWTALELPPRLRDDELATLLSGCTNLTALSLREGHGVGDGALRALAASSAAGALRSLDLRECPLARDEPLCAVFAAARLGAFHAVGCDKLTDRGVAELACRSLVGATLLVWRDDDDEPWARAAVEEYRPPPPPPPRDDDADERAAPIAGDHVLQVRGERTFPPSPRERSLSLIAGDHVLQLRAGDAARREPARYDLSRTEFKVEAQPRALREVSLGGLASRITDRGITLLADCCPMLRRVRLQCKQITDRAVERLALRCGPRLEHVDLSVCVQLEGQTSGMKLSPASSLSPSQVRAAHERRGARARGALRQPRDRAPRRLPARHGPRAQGAPEQLREAREREPARLQGRARGDLLEHRRDAAARRAPRAGARARERRALSGGDRRDCARARDPPPRTEVSHSSLHFLTSPQGHSTHPTTPCPRTPLRNDRP